MAWSLRRFLLAAALASLHLLANEAVAQQMISENFREGDGLSSMATRCLTQDSVHALWICTDNGLFRFDGFRIHRQTSPIPSGTTVEDAIVGANNLMWVATSAGLYLRDASEGEARWSQVLAPNGDYLYFRAGRLDINGNGDLYGLDRTNRLWTVALPTTFSASLSARAVDLPLHGLFDKVTDADGGPVRTAGEDVWLGCGKKLCQWAGGRLRLWGKENGLSERRWGTLFRDHEGGIWARASDALAHLRPGSNAFTQVNAPSTKRWQNDIAMAEDSQGNILTATDAGIACWDGTRWKEWSALNGIPETHVRSLLFDNYGELWFGTAGRGLYHWIGYNVVDHWTTSFGLPSPVVSGFARDGSGRLWAATQEGLAWLDEQSQRFRPLSSLRGGRAIVYSLAIDKVGNLWWIQNEELWRLSAGKLHASRISRVPGYNVAMSSENELYISGPHRLQRLEVKSGNPTLLQMPPNVSRLEIADRVITDGTSDWLPSSTSICRIEMDRCTTLLDENGRPIEVSHYAAFKFQNELWAADNMGISVYKVEHNIARLEKRIASSAFGEASILFLRADKAGRIWLGTDHGVFIVSGGLWTRMDRSNGLVFNDIDTQGFFLDKDQTAWIGTSAGLTRVTAKLTYVSPPKLRIDDFDFGSSSRRLPPRGPISWQEREIRITVGTPNLGHARDKRLEYRLQNNLEWQVIDGNTVRLQSLASGPYNLEIRPVNDLPLNPPVPPLKIDFSVAPAWWLSRRLLAADVIVLFALWWFSIAAQRKRARRARLFLERAIDERTSQLESSRQSLKQLGEYNARLLEAERTRVARELHDEMGQQLAALRMEISVTSIKNRASVRMKKGELDEWLSVLLDRVDCIVSSVRNVVSELRPIALDAGLVASIDWLVSQTASPSRVKCHVVIDEDADRLPSDWSAAIFRIMQEAFNNIRKHAHAENVFIKLKRTDTIWVLTVIDDGTGFDRQQCLMLGHGLLGMEERARLLEGNLSIESFPGRGTTIRLTFVGP